MKMLTICKVFGWAVAWLAIISVSPTAFAQQSGGFGTRFEVDDSVEQIEIIAGSSRRLKFEYKVPELLVENPEVIRATPVAPNEILVSALKPGISAITVSDANRRLQTITIHVTVDVRKLEAALVKHFPQSTIRVHALQTGVILSGNVARADHIDNVMAVARDYFPTNVINQMAVDGSQLVAIKVKVYEVSRTKLRELGVDWAFLSDDFSIVSSVADLIQEVSASARTLTAEGQNISFGVLNDSNSFNAFIEALEQNNLAKLLDQPTLVAQHGRPAEFLSGGEIPIAVASGLGTNSIEFRPFGTKLDMVPLIHGQGELTLEVRAEVSEIANDLTGNTGVPGFRVRRVNTGVRMKSGHTLALAGDYREDVEVELKGIPGLMDSPIWGPLFRRTEEQKNETELVFLITPRFINEVDPTMIPRHGPGQLTTSPSHHELYLHGYTEVPRCQEDCPTNDRFDDPASMNFPNYSQRLQQHIKSGGGPVAGGEEIIETVDPQTLNRNRKPAPAVQPPYYQPAQSRSGFNWPAGRR